MSQVFAADSVSFSGNTGLSTTNETAILTGNFLSPPFQNAKAIVLVSVTGTAGTGATAIELRIKRNPNGENLLVYDLNYFPVTAGVGYAQSIQVANAIPDGRAVQYQVTLQQQGATGNGFCASATVTVFLVSG